MMPNQIVVDLDSSSVGDLHFLAQLVLTVAKTKQDAINQRELATAQQIISKNSPPPPANNDGVSDGDPPKDKQAG